MSWSSGSSIMSDIIVELENTTLSKAQRTEVYETLIPIFEDNDCDTLDECLGEDMAFDHAWELSGHEPADNEEFYDEEVEL